MKHAHVVKRKKKSKYKITSFFIFYLIISYNVALLLSHECTVLKIGIVWPIIQGHESNCILNRRFFIYLYKIKKEKKRKIRLGYNHMNIIDVY